jgi:hypothetical protein
MLNVSNADFYNADKYAGELAEGKNLVFGISSYWDLAPGPGNISIRVEIYFGTDLADNTQTFTKAKVSGNTIQFFQPPATFFLPSAAKAQVRWTPTVGQFLGLDKM